MKIITEWWGLTMFAETCDDATALEQILKSKVTSCYEDCVITKVKNLNSHQKLNNEFVKNHEDSLVSVEITR